MKKFTLYLLLTFWLLQPAFSQRLGINTTTPLETLDVRGNGYFSDKLGIGQASPQFPLSFSPVLGDKISLWGNGGPNYGLGIQSYLLQIHTDVSSADIAFGYGHSYSFTETMRIKGNGNVGIGTNNPLAKLHVKDNSVLFTGAYPLPATPGNPPIEGNGVRMMWYPDKAAFRAGYAGAVTWNKDSIGDFSIALGTVTQASGLASTALGNKTIASGNSSTALGFKTVASGGDATAMGAQTIASGGYSTAMGWMTTAKAMSGVSLGVFNDDSDTPNPNSSGSLDRIFQIGNGGDAGPNPGGRSNAMTVLRNGNVGIGITTPAQRLHTGSGTVRFEGTASPGGTALSLGGNGDVQVDAPGIVAGRFVIKDNGNIGIGNSNPSQKLQVNGNICATGIISNCSDIRYKQNIAPIAQSLSSVLSLHGLYYHWKKNEFPEMEFGDERQLGFSAQEVENLFPEVVMTDANGYKSVDYGRLTPLLVEAIKEQQKQIDAQQQQINAQQQQIDELKKMMEKILK